MCGAEVTALPEDQQLERQLAIKTLASREASVRAVTVNVPSPCVSVCRMDAGSGLCEGCFRTIEEIRAWSGSDDAAKKLMWARLTERLAQAYPTAIHPSALHLGAIT